MIYLIGGAPMHLFDPAFLSIPVRGPSYLWAPLSTLGPLFPHYGPFLHIRAPLGMLGPLLAHLVPSLHIRRSSLAVRVSSLPIWGTSLPVWTPLYTIVALCLLRNIFEVKFFRGLICVYMDNDLCHGLGQNATIKPIFLIRQLIPLNIILPLYPY